MKRRDILALPIGFLVAFVLVINSNVLTHTPAKAKPTTVLIGAAASLQNVLEELNPIFEKANPGIRANYHFAASGALQQQIEQGAPVDLFISAASRQMDALQQKNLILIDTRRNLLTNRLTLVIPRNSTSKLTDFRQLTNTSIKRIALGEPRSVPAGQYAEEVFRNLGILDSLRPKLVYGNSVRSVLGSVETGNADAGVVYATDAKISNQVKAIATAPNRLHSTIAYPIAIVAASRNQQAARIYAQFLQSKQAQALFRRHGFGTA